MYGSRAMRSLSPSAEPQQQSRHLDGRDVDGPVAGAWMLRTANERYAAPHFRNGL